MKIVNILLLASALTFSSGCQSVVPVEVHNIQENKIKLNLPSPKKLDLNSVEWHIIESDNKVYYCLDNKSYKNLSSNLLQIQQYMIQQNNIINSYRSYYEGSQD